MDIAIFKDYLKDEHSLFGEKHEMTGVNFRQGVFMNNVEEEFSPGSTVVPKKFGFPISVKVC